LWGRQGLPHLGFQVIKRRQFWEGLKISEILQMGGFFIKNYTYSYFIDIYLGFVTGQLLQ